MRYLLRRLGFFVLTLWAALTLNFLIPRLMPGNPASAMMARFHGQLSPGGDPADARRRSESTPHQNLVIAVRRLPAATR